METATEEPTNGHLGHPPFTIDEMLERYPRYEVEKAIYRIDYPGYGTVYPILHL
jgi:hypothetical protein